MLFLGSLVLLISIFIFLVVMLMRPPHNNPKAFLKKRKDSEKKTVVFIGDSLTHATLNESYPKRIAKKFPQFDFVNAGVNGYMTVDILGRLDNIVRCKPDLVTILLGTNDANGSIPGNSGTYEKSKFFPEDSSKFWTEERFRSDYSKIVEILKERTNANIALLSLPPLGEELGSPQFERSVEYSNVIKEIAEENNFAYLPAGEKMIEYLEEHPSNSHIPFAKSNIAMFKAVFSHYLLRKSWDEISERNGFSLLTDHIHLNNKAVSIIEEAVEGFITKN